MNQFRLLLIAIIAILSLYTVVVISQQGVDFLTPFYADIAKMGWPGQFNMDFHAFLILGSIWLMWRHHFSGAGILLGLLVFPLGAPYLCSYLLVASFKANGDAKTLLLGIERA